MAAPGLIPNPRLRILLAEDDPTSLLFLSEALQELGYAVECCTDGEQALTLAQKERFDLLLLDCRMPGLGAPAILERLNADVQTASRTCPAIASSAEITPQLRARLLQSGFHEVLHKPLSVAELERVLARVLPAHGRETLLDNDAALETSGDLHTLTALRGLFADELQALLHDIDALARTPTALSERLHRLRASCGFCGAHALANHSETLSRCTTMDARKAALQDFKHTLNATIAALKQTASTP
jgi:CheY-like chemotaxis protein